MEQFKTTNPESTENSKNVKMSSVKEYYPGVGHYTNAIEYEDAYEGKPYEFENDWGWRYDR